MLGEAFLLREGEEFLSANWLEFFQPVDRGVQIAAVRQTLLDKGRRVAGTAFFAVLNVGTTVVKCKMELNVDLRFIALGETRDPSHTGIYGLTVPGLNQSKSAEALAASVNRNEVYPALQ